MKSLEGMRRLGCKKSPPDLRDFTLRAPRRASSPEKALDLPRSEDYTKEMFSEVEDQGGGFSCVGFAASAMKEYQEKTEWGTDINLSARFIYEEARKIDGFPDEEPGTNLRSAMKVLKSKGVCTEDSWPYTGQQRVSAYAEAAKYRIAGYASIAEDNDDRKFALIRRGPFVTGITIFDNWRGLGQPGVIPDPPQAGYRPEGGHAICVVGYDDTGRKFGRERKGTFKFKNSWGEVWGDGGYGYIPYDYMAEYGFDAWTSVDIGVPDILLESKEIAEEAMRALLEELRYTSGLDSVTEIAIRIGDIEAVRVLRGEGS